MGRRSILLISALAVAALGTALVFVYANQARTAGLAAAEPVQVLVASDTIAAGTSGSSLVEAGSVELQTLPSAAVPANALSDLQPVSGLFTASVIYPGQVLLAPMFTSPDAVTALSLPEGTMGVSVSLEDPNRVAGFVTPGSEVAVFATVQTDGNWQTNVLLDRVKVVAVGPSTVATRTQSTEDGTNTEEIPTAILTLAVSEEQAKRLVFADSEGSLHFALLDPSSQVSGGGSVNSTNIFG
jgi:pilus assembly protein CpaB